MSDEHPLVSVAFEQAATVRRAVEDWWRAKNAGEDEPGRIYGRRMVTACWELYETVERLRDERAEHRERVNTLLKEFRDALGVSRDGLWFAARAITHRADATVGGRSAKYFGGPPVAATTSAVQRMETSIGVGPQVEPSPDDVLIDDVAITLAGQNPDRGVQIAADAAHEAASYLVDELLGVFDVGTG